MSAPFAVYGAARGGSRRHVKLELNSWRRRRDSNPRYGFRPYNGLANRRLQPLGHVSGDGTSVSATPSTVKDLDGRPGGVRPATSVPIPKFASPCGTLSCELRNQRDTSKLKTLVWFLDLKFLCELAAYS